MVCSNCHRNNAFPVAKTPCFPKIFTILNIVFWYGTSLLGCTKQNSPWPAAKFEIPLIHTHSSCGKAILSVTKLRRDWWPTELTQGGGLLLNYSSDVGKVYYSRAGGSILEGSITAGVGSSNMLAALFIDVWSLDKTWVCGRSPAEIVASNPTGVINVCLLWVLCVVR
jgi:hypothetical protein